MKPARLAIVAALTVATPLAVSTGASAQSDPGTLTTQSCSGTLAPLAFYDQFVQPPTNQNPTVFSVAQFDAALGTLESVSVDYQWELRFRQYGETTANPAAAPYSVRYMQYGQAELTGPGLPAFSGFPVPTPPGGGALGLPPSPFPPTTLPALAPGIVGANATNTYDATGLVPEQPPVVDFQGTGGYDHTDTLTGLATATVTAPADLATYTGTGTVSLQGIADGSVSLVGGGGNGSFNSGFTPKGRVCLTYTYLPTPPPVVPEVPVAVLLPLSAAAVGGLALVVSNRRRATS